MDKRSKWKRKSSAHLARCARCGCAFATIGSRICPECFEWLDEVYGKVRTFLRDNGWRRFTPAQAAEILDVPVSDIHTLVRIGHLDLDTQNRFDPVNEYKTRQKPLPPISFGKSSGDGTAPHTFKTEPGGRGEKNVRFGHDRERPRR